VNFHFLGNGIDIIGLIFGPFLKLKYELKGLFMAIKTVRFFAVEPSISYIFLQFLFKFKYLVMANLTNFFKELLFPENEPS